MCDEALNLCSGRAITELNLNAGLRSEYHLSEKVSMIGVRESLPRVVVWNSWHLGKCSSGLSGGALVGVPQKIRGLQRLAGFSVT